MRQKIRFMATRSTTMVGMTLPTSSRPAVMPRTMGVVVERRHRTSRVILSIVPVKRVSGPMPIPSATGV